MINSVGAILLISQDAKNLKDFYVDVLDIPLVDEIHDDTPLHYGCDIGAVHFAIHPAEHWPGKATPDSLSPVIALMADDLTNIIDKLGKYGIDATPADHGFANVIAFRDPDGNHLEICLLYTSDAADD